MLTSFLPGRLEGGVNARLLLPECPEDGGALSLPRCKDDDGAWGGAGGGVREGGIAYSSSVRQGEGGLALDPSLVCEEAGFDSSQSSSLVSEQRSRTTVLAPLCSNRSCCCRGRGCRVCRGCRVGGPSTGAPLLCAGHPAPPPGGLVGLSS